MNLDQYNQIFMFLERLLWKQEKHLEKNEILETKLDTITKELRELKHMAFDLSALVTQVAATQSAEHSAVLVIQTIAQEIQDALASDEADAKSQLTFLVGQLQDSANALGQAVANVPVANSAPANTTPVVNTAPVDTSNTVVDTSNTVVDTSNTDLVSN